MSNITNLAWEDPAWQAEAHAWIAAQLRRHDLALTGRITQPHIRPWSTVMAIPTDRGPHFFKALPPALSAEVSFTRALADWFPKSVPALLAIDAGRGWALIVDAGVPLRARIKAEGAGRHWQMILPIYAQIQQATAARAQTLLSLGLPDRRPARLPALYADLLAQEAALFIDQEDGLTSAEYARLLALRPQVEAMSVRLASFGLPETIEHSDFHDGNIFMRGDDYQFLDWGDASLSHPFFSLLVAQRSAAHTLSVAEDDPTITAMRDVYLEQWTPYADPVTLRAAFDQAQPLAMIVRALVWHQAASTVRWPGGSLTSAAAGAPGWLQEFLAHMPPS